VLYTDDDSILTGPDIQMAQSTFLNPISLTACFEELGLHSKNTKSKSTSAASSKLLSGHKDYTKLDKHFNYRQASGGKFNYLKKNQARHSFCCTSIYQVLCRPKTTPCRCSQVVGMLPESNQGPRDDLESKR